MGALAVFHSTRTKTLRPEKPMIKGARTLADFQGLEVPPVVMP
jgi:hypothetical protein